MSEARTMTTAVEAIPHEIWLLAEQYAESDEDGSVSTNEVQRISRAIMKDRARNAPDGGEAKPVAWVIPGDDNANMNGFIDAMAYRDGEFTKPLYAAPTPPAVNAQDVGELAKEVRILLDILIAQGRHVSPVPRRETNDDANSRDESDQVLGDAIVRVDAALAKIGGDEPDFPRPKGFPNCF